MRECKVHIGDVFGRLTIIASGQDREYKRNNKIYFRRTWLCLCECGNRVEVREDALLLNNKPTRSCGCFQKDSASMYMITHPPKSRHGDSRDRLHNIWYLMLYRCNNISSRSYPNYGGRGITVCDQWSCGDMGYFAFKEWALSNGYADNLTIDRIDNDGSYSPDNCRWVSNYTQANNKRSNIVIEFDGRSLTLSQWAKELGMPMKALYARLNQHGWSVDRAFEQPLRQYHNR